jgi:hypothetical protein
MPPRRQPMKRTPGPAGGTLNTGTPRKRIAPQSAKRKAEQQVRRALAGQLEGARCQLRLEVCTGGAEHWHELVGAGVGGSRTDLRNLTPACDACNGYLEQLPDRYERGLKVRAVHAVPGRDGLVPAVAHPLAAASDHGWS